MRLFTIVI